MREIEREGTRGGRGRELEGMRKGRGSQRMRDRKEEKEKQGEGEVDGGPYDKHCNADVHMYP